MTDWQPIEEAPKDENVLILATDGVRISAVIYRNNEWEFSNLAGTGFGMGFYPTHFQYLPTPPNTKE